MKSTNEQTVFLYESLNTDCYQLNVANNGPGFNHFDLYVDHANKIFHIFDSLNYLDPDSGTSADQHAYCEHNNLMQRICTSLGLNHETYYKAVIYNPSSNTEGFWTEHYDVKRYDLESIKYKPFVQNAKKISGVEKLTIS